MASRLLLIFVSCFLVLVKLGETSILHDDSKADELISKLEREIEATAKDLTPVVLESMDILQVRLTNSATRADTSMETQQSAWNVLLGNLKAQAAQRKVNIDSCLGQRQIDLEQQYKVNSDRLSSCDNNVITTGNESIKKFQQALGETSLLPDDSETDELIAKLEKDVEATAKDLSPAVEDSLDMLQVRLTNSVIIAETSMENQQSAWTVLLGNLKAQAAQRKVNIDSCLGQREIDLEQQYEVNSDKLSSCDNNVITTGEESVNKFHQVISSARTEVQNMRRLEKACGEKPECLEQLTTKIRSDLDSLTSGIRNDAYQSIWLLINLLNNASECSNNALNSFNRNGGKLYSEIANCVESKI